RQELRRGVDEPNAREAIGPHTLADQEVLHLALGVAQDERRRAQLGAGLEAVGQAPEQLRQIGRFEQLELALLRALPRVLVLPRLFLERSEAAAQLGIHHLLGHRAPPGLPALKRYL